MKPFSRGLEGGFRRALRGFQASSRGLEGGFKPFRASEALRGLQKGFKGASRGAQGLEEASKA